MTRLTLRRFDIVRTANIVAVLYALIFAVFGLVFLLPFALIGGIAGGREGGAGLAAAGLVGGIIFYVLIVAFYAVAGWIFAAIACAAYNFVAGRIGGIRVDVIAEGPSGGYPRATRRATSRRSTPTRRGTRRPRRRRPTGPRRGRPAPARSRRARCRRRPPDAAPPFDRSARAGRA